MGASGEVGGKRGTRKTSYCPVLSCETSTRTTVERRSGVRANDPTHTHTPVVLRKPPQGRGAIMNQQ